MKPTGAIRLKGKQQVWHLPKSIIVAIECCTHFIQLNN